MNYIITTVGLSSLTNGLKEKFKAGDIYKYSNSKEKDIDKISWKIFSMNLSC
ncbi:hypothetical protein [Hippea jasoniae]|uniref:hypothetical protein n=1 Tax=Hippea jasoniae TaxID=944479 RepID=UPI000ACD1A1B|nr:hypothetical protein [Hippea jasoniae]